jgi:membrane protein DedA with SNARE-associated domain
VITVPTLPLIFAGLLGLQPKLGLMFVPFLSQHLLMTTVVRAEEIEPLHMMVSAGSTLVFGAILTYIAGRLYRREALLG